MNPLAFLGIAFFAIYAAYSVVVLTFRLPRLKFDETPSWLGWTVRIGVALALIANWIWLIIDKR